MNSTDHTDTLLPVSEVLRTLGLGRTTFYGLVAKGDLQAVKLGRRTFVRGSELKRFITNLPVVRRPPPGGPR